MDIKTGIDERRSVRKFERTPLPHGDMEKIIRAGMQAPSSKNRQPWRVVVVEGEAKNGMLNAMANGIRREAVQPKLPRSASYLSGAQHTLAIMEEAPVTVFVINPQNTAGDFPREWEAWFYESANIQSVGACIQNMLLTATDLGYGSLWICDIYFAYEEISAWLGTDKQVLAAVSFGIPAQKPNPAARPRKELRDTMEWKRR